MKIRNLYIAGIALLALVVVALFPVLLSSAWFQNFFVAQVNRHISGTLSLGACTVGWRQGLQCGHVVYEDVDLGIDAVLPSLKSNRGLLAFMAAPSNFGTITIDNPVLTFSGTTEATVDQPVAPVEVKTPPGDKYSLQVDTTDNKKSAQNSVSFWEKITARLLINDAVVNVLLARDSAEIFIQKGNITANLTDGSVQFELDLRSNNDKGMITAVGFVNFPARKGALLDNLVTEINLHVANLKVDPFLSLIPDHDTFPLGWGELSSELLIQANGIKSIQVSGTNMLHEVHLSGGVLGQDQVRFKQIDCNFDVQNETWRSWKLSGLQLYSDFGKMELAGNVSNSHFMINGTGTIDLSVLLGQFSQLFNVRSDTRLENGVMDFTINLNRDGQQFAGVADALVAGLGGMQRGKPFVWNNPMHLHVDGSLQDGEPEIGKIVVTSPFFDLKGNGELKKFSLKGTADFSRAVAEIGRIFRLDGWDAGGKLHFIAESTEDGADRYIVKTRMEIADFSLSQRGKPVVPKHTLTVRGRLKTPARIPDNRADAMDLFFVLSAWPGSLHGNFDSIYRKDGQFSALYQLQTDFYFGRMTDLLHTLELLDRETTVTGSMSSRCSGYIEGSRLMVREFDSLIRDFKAHDHGKSLVEPLFHVFSTRPGSESFVKKPLRPLEVAENSTSYFVQGAGCSMFDNALHQGVLHDMTLTSAMADVHVQRLSVGDWRQLPAQLSVQADGTVDFRQLTSVLHQYGVLTPEQVLTGNGSFIFDLNTDKEAGPKLSARLQGDSLAFTGIELQQYVLPVSMENGHLQAELRGVLNNGDFSLSPNIDYNAVPPPITLPEAEQVLTDVQFNQPLVDKVLKRIHPLFGQLVSPSGALTAQVDRFYWPLVAGGEQQADFSVMLKVSKITLAAKGVVAQILQMAGLADQPLSLEQSEITCVGNAGRIRCTPLKIQVADSFMMLAGSVGFDGSLDYLLEIPVTRKLVGKQGYQVLQGTTLKVPIRGNSDQIVFDRKALSAAIASLMTRAAEKEAGRVIHQQVDNLLHMLKNQ